MQIIFYHTLCILNLLKATITYLGQILEDIMGGAIVSRLDAICRNIDRLLGDITLHLKP